MLKYKFCIAVIFAFICQITFAQQKQADQQVIIPFQLTSYNNLSVQAILNKKDTLNLMFHTAASSLMLTEEATKKLKSLSFDRVDTVKSWGGSGNSSRFSKNNLLQIGSLQWDNVPFWEDKNSGQETDGKFGLNLFADKVVEIDFDKKIIVLHTNLPSKLKSYQKLKLSYQDEMMFIEASSEIGKNSIKNKFLVHSGYYGAVLFDDQFTAENKIDGQLKIVAEKELKDSYGNVLKTKKAILPSFSIGTQTLINVPVGFFTGALGRQKMSIIGGDVLKRFNMIIDAKREYIYLKTNKLKNTSYSNS